MYFNNKFFICFFFSSFSVEWFRKNEYFYAVPILKSPFKTREKVELGVGIVEREKRRKENNYFKLFILG